MNNVSSIGYLRKEETASGIFKKQLEMSMARVRRRATEG